MSDLNALPLPELFAELNSTGLVRRLLELARDEDLGPDWELGDVTSRALVPGYVRGRANIAFRTPGIVSGLAALEDLLFVFKADVDLTIRIPDGQPARAGGVAAILEGDMRAILRVERAALNLLSRLAGIATRTALFVNAAAQASAGAGVYDTRKTTPGLRMLEKYAVRCGGGRLHRIGLFDAALIKDNHLAAIGDLPGSGADAALVRDVQSAVRKARAEAPRAGLRFIELEVDTLAQLDLILAAGPIGLDIILLDNMTPDQLREAVRRRDAAASTLELEASGGVTLETIGAIAATGVERISTGSLTHAATSIDIGLDI
ncbi:carboxylating nicotinate-nucleotide diphosphorylase [soil metagenome]